MEETNTTKLPLSYITSGYVDYGENIEYECSGLPYGLIIFAGVCIGISVCGLVGNGIVLWFLGFHTRQNPFTVYILNLAVAEFSLLLSFLLLILAIFSSTAICSYMNNFYSSYIHFVVVVEFLCDFFDLSSLGLLTAVSVERCISVLFPIWYRCHRPKHLSGVKRCPGKLYIAVLINGIFFLALGIPFSLEFFLSLPSSHKLFSENTYFLLALLNCSINPVIYFLVGSCRQCRFQGSVKVALRQVFEEKVVSEEETNVPEDTTVESTV
ncbi:PREDICTED: mas-related G-protein coupled receptor member H-like [Mesitornis unicolor]|uniref:mas-related G-protein coupled receptor member H-like n=1 Tax=Mesitornis unicolor TaxID=54374 RepID=UPI0005289CFA|nr:PREDICTED: mas-related G-protein coupled receptor member H-like [Mesitornis unicolor]